MLGDVVDYGRWMFHRDHSGLYFSAYTLIVKTCGGLGVALGFMLIGWFGFDATAAQQTAQGAFGIRFITMVLPGCAFFATAPFVWRYPLDRRAHAEILRELREREHAARVQRSTAEPVLPQVPSTQAT